jgi:signal transduction histidine kinase
MFLNFRRYQAFNDEKREIIETFASQIALSLEIARLSRRLILLSQEEERKRIARDLHDQVSQNLVALTVGLESLAEAIPPKLRSVRKPLARLQTLVTRTLRETKQLMSDLRPPLLQDLGLIPAVQLYAESRLAQVRITPQIELIGEERRLSPHTETALFRIIQEAITNVVKHAEAETVSIRIVFESSSIQLTIADDGKGFSFGNPDSDSSFGLQGMKERVLSLRGDIDIDPRLEHGTTIAVTIPIGEGQ